MKEKNYKNINWEMVNRHFSERECNYNENLTNLKRKGFERNPSPSEISEIIVKSYDDSISVKESRVVKSITSNIFKHVQEFTNTFCYRDNKELYFYENVNNVETEKTEEYPYYRYLIPDDLKPTKVFDIGQVESRGYGLEYLNEINPDLVEYLFSRKYEDLPNYFLKDWGFGIPKSGLFRPITRGVPADKQGYCNNDPKFYSTSREKGYSRGINKEKILSKTF
ncbi:hypothetical protein ACFL1H_00305 [Nanoarchaeota archaeon]